MGQQESKQKLELMTQSVNKIRKDIRNGKITTNDVERIRRILDDYSNQLNAISPHMRGTGTYTAKQLIEITYQELDGIKSEVNLDRASVPTNSFKRTSAKNVSKSKRKSVKSITETVQDIRQQLRDGKIKPQDYERYQRELIDYSQVVARKNKNKTEVDPTQKLISSVTQELFTASQQPPPKSSLKTTSDSQKEERRSSLTDKRSSTLERRSAGKQEPKKESHTIANKNAISSLEDIENKLETLKNELKVAETNRDKRRLHFLSKSIETLMTDVQMVNIGNQILKEERKELLEMNLKATYKEIDNVKRQLTREKDTEYLMELQRKEKKEKFLQDLEDMERSLENLSASLNRQNFQAEKETYLMYKQKLDAFEELDEKITERKSKVADILSKVEQLIVRLEMEERLNQAEWRHFQYKIDLQKFPETSDSNSYKKHRQYLQQLMEYVNKVLEVNNTIIEKKKYMLYNIENNIAALDKKAKENDDKLQKDKGVTPNPQTVELRTPETPKDLANKLLATCKDMTSYSIQDLQNMLQILNAARVIIQEKLIQLENPRYDLPDVQLVTVKEKQLEPVANSTYTPQTQIEHIEEKVKAINDSIDDIHYTKEAQVYKDTRNQLENLKTQVTDLSEEQEDTSSKSVLRHIDSVQLKLDKKVANRKSTTEDILTDIMSVSTRVAQLGSKIQSFSYNPQDYDFIKNSLVENRRYLRSLPIASTRTSLLKSRDETIQQIEHHLATLEQVGKIENPLIPHEQQKFNQEVRKIKEKVSRYSGTYKNVLYKTIENDLDKHLAKVDNVFKDANSALKIRQDLENTKMILEQKSIKDSNYNSMERHLQDQRRAELNEIKRNIDSVIQELNHNESLSKEDLDKLDARLTLAVMTLDNIKDDYAIDERENLRHDTDLLFQTIQQLMMTVDTQLSPSPDSPQPSQVDEEQIMLDTIASIQRDIEEVKPQILTYVGSETSPGFLPLDEILVKGTMELDKIKPDQNSELSQMKFKLLKEIQELNDILDDRIAQFTEVEKLEKEVNVMLIKIDSFNGYLGDNEYRELDEEIIRLRVEGGKLTVCPELLPRKEACMTQIVACMKKLDETAKSHSSSVAGTLV